MTTFPEKIAPEAVIETLLERKGAYNPFNVRRFICIDQAALAERPEIFSAFADFITAYEFDVAVLCPAGSGAGENEKFRRMLVRMEESARNARRTLTVVDDELSLARLMTDGFPVLYIGRKESNGFSPLMHLNPDDDFFTKGSEFWMGSMAKARSVINRPKNIETIAPSPDYL